MILLAALTALSQWIGVDALKPDIPNGACDTARFVKTFVNEKEIRRAVWTISGLGAYEARVNGRVPYDDVLEPGYTHREKRRLSFEHDVTAALRLAAGATNVLSAEVSSGWWRDEIVHFPYDPMALPPSAFRGELRLDYADGSSAVVPTDASWRASYGGEVRRASIYWGETYDARVDAAWRETGVVDWPAAKIDATFKGVVSDGAAARILLRRDIELKPVAAYVWKGVEGSDETRFGRVKVVRRYCPDEEMTLDAGETLVVDFGQNAAGLPELTAIAEGGTTLVGHPAEMLNDRCGEKSRRNDGPGGSAYVENYRLARTTLTYVFKGIGDWGLGIREEFYRPRFTFYGGRYFSFTTTGRVTLKKLTFVPICSIPREKEVGSIRTGRDDLNRLIDNCVWGMRGNYISVPTDCPQRDERQGWTGDTQVFSGAAVYAADCYDFLTKWMADVRDGQFTSGRYEGAFMNVAPLGACGHAGHMLGWGDAGVIIPYRLWLQTGDTRLPREHYAAMKKFMSLIQRTKYVGRDNERQCCDWLSAEKLETWRMLYGLARGGEGPRPGETKADMLRLWRFHGRCQLIADIRMMRAMAAALGETEDARLYAEADRAETEDFRRTQLDADGMLDPLYRDMQTPAAIALTLGLFPEGAKKRTAAELVALVKAGDFCIKTGFLGTAVLLDALADCAGDSETAYSVLLNHGYPSWLYSVDQGATTIWERWNGYTKEKGFGPSAMNSFNHYAYGAVLGWMYRTMAGIRPDPEHPGFARFVLAPKPDKRVGSVRACFDSRRGPIRSAWCYEGDACTWTFEIPKGTRAKVVLPNGKTEELGEGTYERKLN